MRRINTLVKCIIIITFYINDTESNLHRCDLPLGMENGNIRDDAITASVGSNEDQARLNNNGAWCFHQKKVQEGQNVTLTVDLGQTIFVTGLKTQGPPTSLKRQDYNYQIEFSVMISTSVRGDDPNWLTLGGSNTKFSATDKSDESNQVTIHAFGGLHLAAKIQLRFQMGWMGLGDTERCFRIEILGCSPNLVPLTNLELKPLLPGRVEASWNIPTVLIPGEKQSYSYQLIINHFIVNSTWSHGSLKNSSVHVSQLPLHSTNIMIHNPVWGANYSLSLTCPYNGLTLPCGSKSIVATVDGCIPTLPNCHKQDQVTFREPQELNASTVRPSTVSTSSEPKHHVYLSWNWQGPGWVTLNTLLMISDEWGREQWQKNISNEISSVLIQNLFGTRFTVVFIPEVIGWIYSPFFEYQLHIVQWSSVNLSSSSEGYGAFINYAHLQAEIIWEGKLGVSWSSVQIKEKVLKSNKLNEDDIINNTINEHSATPISYNVSVTEDNNGHSTIKTVFEQSSLKLCFFHLKLETLYTITIICDFGGLSRSCGQTSIYSELPNAMLEIDNQKHVYIVHPWEDTWSNHEESCIKGNGTLITLASKREEDLLRPQLINKLTKYAQSFWIGLNMCRGNRAEITWSDGVRGDHNLIPDAFNGLSATSCCIKVELLSSNDSFVGKGKPCSSLLPAICEYKPNGLLGKVTDLQKVTATTSSASYSWAYDKEYWTPSHFSHVICPVRDLMTFAALNAKDDQKCLRRITHFDQKHHEFSGLQPFTEYNLTVSPYLAPLQYNGEYESILIRTHSEELLFMGVLSAGFIKGMWAEKVSNFEQDEELMVSVKDLVTSKELLRKKMPARDIKAGSLDLGAQYEVTLEEISAQKRKRSINITAYPPCTCQDCQDFEYCLTPSDRQVPCSQAAFQCREETKEMATSQTAKRLAILLEQANKQADDLWVENSSKTKSGKTPLTFPHHMQNSTEPCLLLSRESANIIVPPDYKEKHYVACIKKAPLSSPLPSLPRIETLVGGTWIRLNWNAQNYGWNTKYTVYYQPLSEMRVKRGVQHKEFSKLPILLDGLEKETAYSMEITAVIGSRFVPGSLEIHKTTTSSSVPYQHKDSGFSGLDKLTAGWSPSPEYYLTHLVCGAFLIAASLTTMMLFIATGMFYQDCMAQLGFLLSVLLAYLLLLVAHPTYVNDEEVSCIVVAALLHFFFMAAFLFLFLEALTISHLLVEKISSPFQISNWLLMITGFGVPLIYVSITAGAINFGYANSSINNCWLNVGGMVLYIQCIPNGIFFTLTLLFLLFTCWSNPENQPILSDSSIASRQSDTYKLRWVVVTMVLELSIAWSAGAAGFHIRSPHWPLSHTIYDVATILLGLTILIAPPSFDDTFRAKLYRLCCGTELSYRKSAVSSIGSRRAKVGPTRNEASERITDLVQVIPFSMSTPKCASKPLSGQSSLFPFPLQSSPNKDRISSTSQFLSKVSPSEYKNSSRISTTTVMTSQKSNQTHLGLPNTPPQPDLSNTILIKRSYILDGDEEL